MKVDFNSKIGYYNQVKDAAKSKSKAQLNNNTDVDEISRGSTDIGDKSMLYVKSGVLRDVSTNASTQRLAELSAQIREGTYKVDADKIAAAMLDQDA